MSVVARRSWAPEPSGRVVRVSQYLHVYVNRLRRKLAAAAPGAGIEQIIRTEPGVGYRITESDG